MKAARKSGLLLLVTILAGCSKTSSDIAMGPPRVDTAPPIATQPSVIAFPITARIVEIERALNERIPKTLWTIDEQKKACVPAQRIFKGKLKITPDISCRIVGQAVRGPITLGGAGETLTLSMPVSVQVSARDIGKIIKKETATAGARVRANARLGMTANWQPTAKVDIDYSWTQVPGINILGQRVKFASKVDPRLQKIISDLERELPRHLATINARQQAAKAWQSGFMSVELNRTNPPVWMRVTPERIAYDGYRIVGKDVQLFLTAAALTETFVGPRPEPKPATTLPKLSFDRPATAARMYVPVTASYTELEPVVAKALGKLAAKGVTIPGVGAVTVRFGKVTIYGTTGGRIAVGIAMEAESPRGVLKPKGTIWLTGVPANDPGSQLVKVRDLKIEGKTDSAAINLLGKIALSASTQAAIEASLSENFAKDYNRILSKANSAIQMKRFGDLLLSARLGKVENGKIQAYGQGLYMPLSASGSAQIIYSP